MYNKYQTPKIIEYGNLYKYQAWFDLVSISLKNEN
jgi:hypothetical protein